MKLERITYQKIFPLGAYSNERIGIEAVLDDTENPQKAMETLRKIVQSMSIPAGVPKCTGPDGFEQVDFESIPDAVRECTDIGLLIRLKPYLAAQFFGLYDNKMKYFLKDRHYEPLED